MSSDMQELNGNFPKPETTKNVSLTLKGRIAWNRGLTKETDDRMKKTSMSLIGRKRGHPPWNKGLTKETDERVKNYGKNSGKSRKGRKMPEETKKKLGLSLKGVIHTKEWNKKVSESKIAEKNPMWNGGRHKTFWGYTLVKCNNHPYSDREGYVREHRLIVEKAIGRYLNPPERIHHINFLKSDNRIENLALFKDESSHTKFHNKLRRFGYHTPSMIRELNECQIWLNQNE
jgi:hypothetical protein